MKENRGQAHVLSLNAYSPRCSCAAAQSFDGGIAPRVFPGLPAGESSQTGFHAPPIPERNKHAWFAKCERESNVLFDVFPSFFHAGVLALYMRSMQNWDHLLFPDNWAGPGTPALPLVSASMLEHVHAREGKGRGG